jgi:hypothetical protein
VLNAFVGFFQEAQAGSIVEELKKTLALRAWVLRDGGLIRDVEAWEVVPGDVLVLEEGTIAPADGRIITEDAFLQVDQRYGFFDICPRHVSAPNRASVRLLANPWPWIDDMAMSSTLRQLLSVAKHA